MKKKIALVFGITGQDGSYLAELLLSKNYEVHGIKRRSSSLNTNRIDHIYVDLHKKSDFFLHYGDLSDTLSIGNIVNKIKPDEIYNLGAQSHVSVSFDMPEYTADIDALGTLRVLEAIRSANLEKKTKFYQASSSELFGLIQEPSQSEKTPFYPRSPYAAAKLYAYWITVNYREAYGIFACNGILFNHESPRRGETFVTRKITRTLSRIYLGIEDCLYLGNLEAMRDWGHAKDYVYMQWLMLQQDKPEDYVISTGKQSSVRDFVKIALDYLGIEIEFKGSGINEVAEIINIRNKKKTPLKKGDIILRIDSRYFRPSEVDSLLGDSSKANMSLGWKPKITLNEMVEEMIENDLKESSKELK